MSKNKSLDGGQQDQSRPKDDNFNDRETGSSSAENIPPWRQKKISSHPPTGFTITSKETVRDKVKQRGSDKIFSWRTFYLNRRETKTFSKGCCKKEFSIPGDLQLISENVKHCDSNDLTKKGLIIFRQMFEGQVVLVEKSACKGAAKFRM